MNPRRLVPNLTRLVVGETIVGALRKTSDVDADKSDSFLPDLHTIVGDGLITVERVEVLMYRGGRRAR